MTYVVLSITSDHAFMRTRSAAFTFNTTSRSHERTHAHHPTVVTYLSRLALSPQRARLTFLAAAPISRQFTILVQAITYVLVAVKIFRKHPRDQLSAYFTRSNFQRSSARTLENNFVADSHLKCTQRLFYCTVRLGYATSDATPQSVEDATNHFRF